MEKKERKKEKKKKERKSMDVEKESLLDMCTGSKNVPPLKDRSNKSSELKRHHDLTQSFPSKKKCRATDLSQKVDSCLAPFKIKKGKNEKQTHLKMMRDTSSDKHHNGTQEVFSQKKKSQQNLECGVYEPRNTLISKEEQFSNNSKRVPKFKGSFKHGSKSCGKEEEPVCDETINQNVNESTTKCTTECQGSGIPGFTANTQIGEKVWDASLGKSPKLDSMCGSSEHSQDLFITQKTYLPAQVSSSTSCESPPPGQKQVQRSYNEQAQMFSQISTLTDTGASEFNVSQCRVESATGNSVMFSHKATQTDGVFSYLALMTFAKKAKVLESCSEKPLDLCLPSRVRAHDVIIKNEVNDVIIISVKPATLCPVEETTRKFSLSQLRKMEGRFVQTLLNSSYFFKGKGERNDAVHIAPLLRQKMETKKRVKKSSGI
ncbi:Hypothetical predicted protein [Pelobates cultripes]|uniref:Uncharacterized protein n=1 Tax=Pelobates cultripes TaxID=61616 RepID=A0AAD1TF44_PELCU|nr:Hypothetical predicted protein [Pelobates cultripes]